VKTFLAILALSLTLSAQVLPNPKLTPGSARTQDKAEICSVKTGTVRHVTPQIRKQAFEEYGIDCSKVACGKLYELDHLLPLECGGDNSLKNLWPQSYAVPGAHQKDLAENRAHQMICSGEITVQEAQHDLTTDWYGFYKRYVRKADVKLGR
jgi:hypothetical protein